MNAPLRYAFLSVLVVVAACGDPADPTPADPSLLWGHHEPQPIVVVDPNGRHGRPTTIQAGIDLVPAGGRVVVLPGTYAEALVINKGLSLIGFGFGNHTVTIAPAGTPTIAVQVATPEPVSIHNVAVVFSGANGIRGDGLVDITVEHAAVTAVNAPLGVSHMVAVFNNAGAGRSRLVVRDSKIDGNVAFANEPVPAFPQSFGLRIQGDVDAVFDGNTVRRTGGACIFVTTRLDLAGVTNADVIGNDVDECFAIGRAGAVLVGPVGALPSPLPPFTANVTVNLIGNTIRNSPGSCLLTAGINYEASHGRIEHNRIEGVVQPCAVEAVRTFRGAIFVGSNPTRNLPAGNVAIRFNDIVGNAHAGLRIAANQTASLDARCNYWGTETGPTIGAVVGSDVVVEAGAAVPVVTPFATRSIANGGRRHHGFFSGRGHDDQSCEVEYSLWSAPMNPGPPVNSTVGEFGAALSPDGLAIYFNSNRPGSAGTDLWVSRRACRECPWGTAQNLGATVNGPTAEGGADFSTDGRLLFFNSDRPGGFGLRDIYVSRRDDPDDDFGWGPPLNLGPFVNTPSDEQSPSYFRGEQAGSATLYFHRGLGGPIPDNTTDIYAVDLSHAGELLAAAVAVTELNDPSLQDASPAVRDDGLEIIFASSRAGGAGGPSGMALDLWFSTRRSIRDAWSRPEYLGVPLNTTGTEGDATLSRDGLVLLFFSGRTGGVGMNDIWMSTRTRIGRDQ